MQCDVCAIGPKKINIIAMLYTYIYMYVCVCTTKCDFIHEKQNKSRFKYVIFPHQIAYI